MNVDLTTVEGLDAARRELAKAATALDEAMIAAIHRATGNAQLRDEAERAIRSGDADVLRDVVAAIEAGVNP